MNLPIEDRLRDIYEELPRSERLLADIIIDFPGDLATHSISELVIRANTSNAAATRLIKRLGYKDFREIRKQARDAKAQGSPRYLHTIDHHSGDFKSEIKQHVDCEVQNLLSSFDALSEEMLNGITECVERADNIWVIGYGNSYMPAMYLRQQLIQLRQCVEILPRPGQAIEKDLSGLSERDLIIVVGFRRRKDVIYRLMKYAQELYPGAVCYRPFRGQNLGAGGLDDPLHGEKHLAVRLLHFRLQRPQLCVCLSLRSPRSRGVGAAEPGRAAA